VIRHLGVFVAAALAFGLAVALAARALWGDAALVFCLVALLICAVPAMATLAWSCWALGRPPEQQMVATLGGTVVRLAIVSAAALSLYQQVEYFRQEPGLSFWAWVLIFYLFTLGLEIVLVLAARPADAAGR
jgi:hypothetical protein